MTTTIHHGDCLDVLRGMPDNSVDAIVTDPPYGLSNTTPDKVADTIVRWATGERDYIPASRGFMGATWDAFVPPPAVWDECFRVLKPGGHLVAFAGDRTQDLMGLSIRLSGMELRSSIAYMFGSGFPKSHDVGKSTGDPRFKGVGTALKPAHEPIILARKPISEKTVAANTLTWGTGGLNIDKTRIGAGSDYHDLNVPHPSGIGGVYDATDSGRSGEAFKPAAGRWPANVVLDPDTAKALDQQSGNRPGFKSQTDRKETPSAYFGADKHPGERQGYNDEGGASRFFKVVEPDPPFMYAAKAPKRERPSYTTEDGQTVQHATVKPLSIMRWLVRLVTPEGGTVLDPFAGSGTTVEAAILEGFNVIGIEREEAYLPLIQQRIDRATDVLPMAS